MFTIGDLARLGGVSVRMLRHYDAVGVLPPASVDPFTGHRAYGTAELHRLNRLLALKDLGFTLEQVRTLLDDRVGPDELRGMLRLRRAELESSIETDRARLARVEARLRLVDKETDMTTTAPTLTSLPPIRLVGSHGVADGFAPDQISPLMQGLFGTAAGAVAAAGGEPCLPSYAYYEHHADGERVVAWAAFPADRVGEPDGLEVLDLPAVEQAVTAIHRGDIQRVDETYQAMAAWVEDQGLRPVDLGREVYLECPPGQPDGWVTEVQIAVGPSA